MSDYPMLISNKLHSFRNFEKQTYIKCLFYANQTSKNRRWDVKEIKILRVFAHTNLCRTKKMPYICPVL